MQSQDHHDFADNTEGSYYASDTGELNDIMNDNGLCDYLSVMQINVQRVCNLNKFRDLCIYLESITYKPDIVVLTETWITKGTESLYEIDGYSSHHCCRSYPSAGIAVYFKTHLRFTITEKSNAQVSVMSMKITGVEDSRATLTLSAFYMPDCRDFPDLESNLDRLLSSVTGQHLIVGDFNINILNSTSISRNYINTIESYGYEIKNRFQTRPVSGSCIDHLIANFDDTVCVTVENDISDHNGTFIFCPNRLGETRPRGFITKSRTKVNYEQIKEDIEGFTLEHSSPESMFSSLHSHLMNTVQQNTSTTIIKVKRNNIKAASWINERLLKLSRRKHRLLRKRRSNVHSHNLEERIAEVSRTVSELKHELMERDKYAKFGPQVDYKKKWRNLNALLGRKTKKPGPYEIRDSDGSLATDPKEMADALNHHFMNIPSVSSQENTRNIFRHSQGSFFMQPTDPAEVFTLIMNTKPKNSVGWDGIPMNVIKACANVLSELLSIIFNSCIESGYYPKELKTAKVVPVFKKGDTREMGNYRPISILPALNKIFEKLIYSRLVDYLDHISFFHSRQYGFRSGASTTTCAIDLLEHVYHEINKGNIVTGVFLDLSKAFDMVIHDKLLLKLDACGIRGVPADLISNYLSGRDQYVTLSGSSSRTLSVEKGVPQGSCLGPLFFLVYINDIGELHLQGEPYLYADDTSLFYSSASVNLNILKAQSDLDNLNSFFNANGLQLNAGKTKLMHLTSSKRTIHGSVIQLKVNEQVVETVSSFRYLGLILDAHLTWKDHNEGIVDKIKPIIGLLYRAKDLLTKDVKMMIYYSMIHSALSYMIVLWGASSYAHLKPIQVLQNRALRNIHELPFLEPRITMYERPEVKVLPIRGAYESALCSFVFSKLGGECRSEIAFNTATLNYHSRGSRLLTKPKCNLELCKRRVGFAGPSSFNNLPDNCRSAVDIAKFKRLSFKHFKSKIGELLLHF